jgi:hypothetical protein
MFAECSAEQIYISVFAGARIFWRFGSAVEGVSACLEAVLGHVTHNYKNARREVKDCPVSEPHVARRAEMFLRI